MESEISRFRKYIIDYIEMKLFLSGFFQKAHDPGQTLQPIRPMFALATLTKATHFWVATLGS